MNRRPYLGYKIKRIVIPVVLIEAQVGEYTGEDDIVRLEDDFKR